MRRHIDIGEMIPVLFWMSVVLLALTIMLFLVRWYRRTQLEDEESTNYNLMSQFSRAHDEGDLEEDEYQRIRAVMIRKARESMQTHNEKSPPNAPKPSLAKRLPGIPTPTPTPTPPGLPGVAQNATYDAIIGDRQSSFDLPTYAADSAGEPSRPKSA